MRLQGKVLNWNDDRGFGFVEPNGGGERAFVHIKAFKLRSRRPINGDVIIYELVRENNNRYKATNIQFARDTESLNKKNNAYSTNSLGIYFILIFCVALLASIFSGKLPLTVAGLYVVMSLVAFITYALDKSAAQNARWRTPESTLHMFSLIGGWPGAFFAQNMLRHKSSKQEFKRVYKITVLLNLGALIWLHTEKGSLVLNNVLSPITTRLISSSASVRNIISIYENRHKQGQTELYLVRPYLWVCFNVELTQCILMLCCFLRVLRYAIRLCQQRLS